MQILAALHVAIFYSGKTGGGALWPLPQQVKRCAIFPVVGRYVYCVDIEACLDLFCPLCHRLGVFLYSLAIRFPRQRRVETVHIHYCQKCKMP